MIIHILWHGKAWCDGVALRGVPSTWPAEHKWVGADTFIAACTVHPQIPHSVNCVECLTQFADYMALALKLSDTVATKKVGSFLWALEFNRPMRRVDWLKHKPISDDAAMKTAAMVKDSLWVWCRTMVPNKLEARWIMLTNGEAVSLTRDDYLASDWEVL